MTDCATTETALTNALTDIRNHWDHMLHPSTGGSIARGVGGTVTLADDHSDTEADTPRIDRIVSLRREVTECLGSWSRVVIEDRALSTRLPHGNDAKAMATFLLIHARWFSGHEAAEDAAGELRKWAHKVRMVVAPEKREWLPIGECPVMLEDGPCGAKVRAYPQKATIHCPRCGTEGGLDWWMSQIAPEGADLANADGVIACVAARLGQIITHEQVWKWASRGVVQRHGKDGKGRTLYSSAAVLAYVAHRIKEEVA